MKINDSPCHMTTKLVEQPIPTGKVHHRNQSVIQYSGPVPNIPKEIL
jgi:hypothetical protein